MSLLLFLLAWVGRARALDWWVPTEAEAAGVRAALAAMWEGADVQVRVGPWPGFGIGSDGNSLWVVADGVDRDEAAPPDPVIRVVLIRAWLRVPPRPVPAATVPPPPRPLVGRRDAWMVHAGGLAGPGFGVSEGAPPLTAAVLAGAAWRQLVLDLVVDGGFGGVVTSVADDHPLVHQRFGGVAMAGLRAPLWGGDFEATLGAGFRVWTLANHLEGGAVRWAPQFALGERLAWWRPVAGSWAFGLALRVDLDDLGSSGENYNMTTVDGSAGHVPPAQAALEVGLRRRWSP